jgi:hypothetical protein
MNAPQLAARIVVTFEAFRMGNQARARGEQHRRDGERHHRRK